MQDELVVEAKLAATVFRSPDDTIGELRPTSWHASPSGIPPSRPQPPGKPSMISLHLLFEAVVGVIERLTLG